MPETELIIPPRFTRATLDLFDESGAAWLKRFPALVHELEERWEMRVQAPFNLTYNYVAPVTLNGGGEAVLKLWHPNPELRSEMAALKHYAGRGIARVLRSDTKRSAMLIERLHPGAPLVEMEDDDEATRVIAGVMRQLWIPAPEDPRGIFPTVKKWSLGFRRLRSTFDGTTGLFPAPLVEQAERLFADLQASSAPPALLHGDLHHGNILSADRAPWLAIDPKGLIGEPAYEIGAMTRNKWVSNDPTALRAQFERRLAIFEEMLGFDRQRMRGWCMAQAVLSAWWTYEDHHELAQPMLAFAQAIAQV